MLVDLVVAVLSDLDTPIEVGLLAFVLCRSTLNQLTNLTEIQSNGSLWHCLQLGHSRLAIIENWVSPWQRQLWG